MECLNLDPQGLPLVAQKIAINHSLMECLNLDPQGLPLVAQKIAINHSLMECLNLELKTLPFVTAERKLVAKLTQLRLQLIGYRSIRRKVIQESTKSRPAPGRGHGDRRLLM
jgi:hypothetical protein